MTAVPNHPDGPGTSGEFVPEVYDELRKLARARLARERQPNQTLQPTALVHEAYLRVSSPPRRWERRGHFFAAAALAMRRILVERARHYQRMKHGGGAEHFEVSEREEDGFSWADRAHSDLRVAHPGNRALERARRARTSTRF